MTNSSKDGNLNHFQKISGDVSTGKKKSNILIESTYKLLFLTVLIDVTNQT